MRLTRTLEERLVNLYRQTKVVGGLFRSLGQEADAVGSAYALERRDILSPLIRNLGSMLVKGATPVEILKQYMAKGDSPTRGRELNIHFGDTERGFIGQISPLGDMVPVMAGVTLTFKMRERGSRRARLRRRRRDVAPARSTKGSTSPPCSAARSSSIVENNGYAYSTPTRKQTRGEAVRRQGDRLRHCRASRRTATTCSRRTRSTKRAVDRARRGEGVTLVELMTYRRKGHAEHDNQSYVPDGRDRALGSARTIRSTATSRVCATSRRDAARRWPTIDARVRREIDEATDIAERRALPEAARRARRRLRRSAGASVRSGSAKGSRSVVDAHERPEGWGTFDAPAKGAD